MDRTVVVILLVLGLLLVVAAPALAIAVTNPGDDPNGNNPNAGTCFEPLVPEDTPNNSPWNGPNNANGLAPLSNFCD